MGRTVTLPLPLNRFVALMATARQFPYVVYPTVGNQLKKAYVFGGADVAGAALSSSERYDPSLNTWAAGAALAAVNFGGIGLLMNTKDILVAGGIDAGGNPVATCGKYTDANSSWAGTGSLATARADFPGVLDTNIFVCGGLTGGASPTTTATSEQYAVAGGTWSAKASLNTARAGHQLVKVSAGQYLAIGGYSALAASAGASKRVLGKYTVKAGALLASVERYSSTTNTWTTKTPMTFARYGHRAVLLSNGLVLVAGGFITDTEGDNPGAVCELYDPAADRWSIIPSMPIGQGYPVVVAIGDANNTVLFFGGDAKNTAAALYTPGPSGTSGFWTDVGPMDSAVGFGGGVLMSGSTNADVLGVGTSSAAAATTAAGLYKPAAATVQPQVGSWSSSGIGSAVDCQTIDPHVASLHVNGSLTGTFDLQGSDDGTNFDRLLQYVGGAAPTASVASMTRWIRAKFVLATDYTIGTPTLTIAGVSLEPN